MSQGGLIIEVFHKLPTNGWLYSFSRSRLLEKR